MIELQYHYNTINSIDKNNESTQEWVCRLRTKAVECQHKEYDRLLTEQLTSGLNNDGILKEVVTWEDTEDATSEYVLLWVNKAELQRTQN